MCEHGQEDAAARAVVQPGLQDREADRQPEQEDEEHADDAEDLCTGVVIVGHEHKQRQMPHGPDHAEPHGCLDRPPLLEHPRQREASPARLLLTAAEQRQDHEHAEERQGEGSAGVLQFLGPARQEGEARDHRRRQRHEHEQIQPRVDAPLHEPAQPCPDALGPVDSSDHGVGPDGGAERRDDDADLERQIEHGEGDHVEGPTEGERHREERTERMCTSELRKPGPSNAGDGSRGRCRRGQHRKPPWSTDYVSSIRTCATAGNAVEPCVAKYGSLTPTGTRSSCARAEGDDTSQALTAACACQHESAALPEHFPPARKGSTRPQLPQTATAVDGAA